MQTICRKCPPFKLGGTLTSLNATKPPRFSTCRGRLPWESPCKFREPSGKKFRKRKIETTQEKYCPDDCEVLKPPKRNSYEWVVQKDERPCGPFEAVVHKTVCEMRKFQKCFQVMGNRDGCTAVAPDCSKNRKVYPMLEAVQKGSLPGCVRPITLAEKTKQ